METKQADRKRPGARLHEWNPRISESGAKAEHALAEVRRKYARELGEIKAKRRKAALKIGELEGVRGDVWGKVQMIARQVRDALGAGIAKANARFK
ncbi:MAG: hypothetical protein FD165_2363 [Gammaproteobacteria bacterium]|nr:MAG: hypothetical protein FD165_2363 [Gammaproteobacteria bacterium]TND01952.1 MAG: hypothetical protein FD120_2480 [Gammaproteobacteria bacterium]